MAARAILSGRRGSFGYPLPLHRERVGGGAEAGSPCSFVWQRRAAVHGRVDGFRDCAGGEDG